MQCIPGLGDTDYRTIQQQLHTTSASAATIGDGQLFQPPLPPKIPLLESPPVKPVNSSSGGGGFSLDILGNAAERSPARTTAAANVGLSSLNNAAVPLFGTGPTGAGLLPRPLSKQSPRKFFCVLFVHT